MNNITRFEKVSFEQFKKDFEKTLMNDDDLMIENNTNIKKIYDSIQLPKRATKGSAGYDFFSPITFYLNPEDVITIPTGIRCKMNDGLVLMLFPRSGHGFKTGSKLSNTIGVIDEDYYISDNEGHIMVKLENNSPIRKTLEVESGKGFCQGVLLHYATTCDDYASEKRNGGFGSTGK